MCEEMVEDMSVEEENVELKYIEWQKDFVNGNQFCFWNKWSGMPYDAPKQFYWQQDMIYNILYKLLRDKLDDESIWGPNKLVDRLIPYQIRYNRLMNALDDLTIRLANPLMAVEDGSVDVDELCEEGLAPGKVLIYRQGSRAPELISSVQTEHIHTIKALIEDTKNEMLDIATGEFR